MGGYLPDRKWAPRIRNRGKISPLSSMENFHPLCRTPSHTDALNLVDHCAKFVHDYAQASIQDFAQGGPKLTEAPKLGAPGQEPQGTPYQKPKSLQIWSTILFQLGPIYLFIFLFLLFNFISFTTQGGASAPVAWPVNIYLRFDTHFLLFLHKCY